MKIKNILLVAVILILAFFLGGWLGQTKYFEKSIDQVKSDLRNYAIDFSGDYLYYNPDGVFNVTAKKIYKDLAGHEYYRPEDPYVAAEKYLRQRPLPTPVVTMPPYHFTP